MSSLSDPGIQYIVPLRVVSESMHFFRHQGEHGHEGVVLWAGALNGTLCTISEVLIPIQITSGLSYRIPEDETFRILHWVSERDLLIPIQVHSHPADAFHSPADDELAFVQHLNAISIVVPDFGRFNDGQFNRRARFYRLAAGNIWRPVTTQELGRSVRIG